MAKALMAALLLIVPVLSGCVNLEQRVRDALTTEDGVDPALFEGLTAEGAETILGPDHLLFRWQETAGTGQGVPLFGSTANSWQSLYTFDVREGIGAVEVFIDYDGGPLTAFLVDLNAEQADPGPLTPVFQAVLADTPGVILCGATFRGPPRDCSSAVPPTLNGTVQWGVVVTSQASTETPFTLDVRLYPPAHVTYGDPSARLSPALAMVEHATGSNGGEPTIGVLGDGAIFVVNGVSVLRSTDDGASWQDVTPPYAPPTSLDPMLRADPWTNRVILDHLYVGCSWAVWSDDGGDTWVTNPFICGTPVNDHQKVAVGGHFLPGQPYDGIIYYLYSDFDDGDVIISRSIDGGFTWTSHVANSPTVHGTPVRRGGPVEADRQGNVYAPGYGCPGFDAREGEGIVVSVSNDHGLTYETSIASGYTHTCEGIDPGMAIDTAGNAYTAWWGPDPDHGDQAVFVAYSTDRGHTWSRALRVTPPDLASFVLVDAAAGDEGRVAVALLATPDTPRGPNAADGWARWYLYTAITEDVFAAEPVWHINQSTPMEDPVQVGTICTSGTGCSGGNRNLLDFIDIQPGPDGRVYVAYTDGCTEPPCFTPADSRDRAGRVAVQLDGPRLFVDRAPWASG